MVRNLKEVYNDTVTVQNIVSSRISDAGNANAKRDHTSPTDRIHDRVRSMAKAMGNKDSTADDLMQASYDLEDIPGLTAPVRQPPTPPAPPARKYRNKMSGERSPTPAPRRNDGGSGGAASSGGNAGPAGGGVGSINGSRSRSRTPSGRSASSEYDEAAANDLGIYKTTYPNDIGKIMCNVKPEEVEELKLYVREIVFNREYEPIAVCEPQVNLTDPTNVNYDPNFTHPPVRFTKLRKKIRDIWKWWTGSWTDSNGDRLPEARALKIAGIE